LKASKEKNDICYSKNNLLNLKIEKEIDKQAIWRIKLDPSFALKKDGDSVSFEDSIYFENSKMKTTISSTSSPILF
jgi:hypothetical protein